MHIYDEDLKPHDECLEFRQLFSPPKQSALLARTKNCQQEHLTISDSPLKPPASLARFEGLLEYGGLSEGFRRIIVGFDSTARQGIPEKRGPGMPPLERGEAMSKVPRL